MRIWHEKEALKGEDKAFIIYSHSYVSSSSSCIYNPSNLSSPSLDPINIK